MKSVELGIQPSAGPDSAYGHPTRRYTKTDDEDSLSTESEKLRKLNQEISAVNGVPSFSISDVENDPDPDPFALKRRFVPDAYGASPIKRPEPDFSAEIEFVPRTRFTPRPTPLIDDIPIRQNFDVRSELSSILQKEDATEKTEATSILSTNPSTTVDKSVLSELSSELPAIVHPRKVR